MATVQFDLVSPERRLATLDASQVQIPGADGDMTAMADHAPTITTLRPGILAVEHSGGTDEYVVSGGFAQIAPDSISVLAEQALPRSEVTQDIFGQMLTEARDAAGRASAEGADEAAKLVADMEAMGSQLGLSA